MIRGIGNDVIEIKRIETALKRAKGVEAKFLARVLSPQELSTSERMGQARRAEFVAGRFAAKEAIAKAIGCGLARVAMNGLDISVGASGLRVTWLIGRQPSRVAEDDHFHVTISHTASLAFATAIWESHCGKEDV